MNQSKTILFFGNERLATGVETQLPVIKALVSNGYNIGAIIISPQHSKTSSRNPRKLEIADFAKKHKIPLLEPSPLRSAVAQLREYGAVAAVLAAYGKMVPQEVIDLFPRGIINLHPSLLPMHRGPTPIESAILSGDTKTGVSLMQLVSEMDAGPVFYQEELLLSGSEQKQELADRLGKLGAESLIRLLPGIISGELTPTPQQGLPSYDKRLEAAFAPLDAKKPALILEREIRAFKGWPRSRLNVGTETVIVTSAHVMPKSTYEAGQIFSHNGSLAVATSEGTLIIERLIPAGGKEMSAQDYLLGHPLQLKDK